MYTAIKSTNDNCTHSNEENANCFAKKFTKGFQPNNVTNNFVLLELTENDLKTQVSNKTSGLEVLIAFQQFDV